MTNDLHKLRVQDLEDSINEESLEICEADMRIEELEAVLKDILFGVSFIEQHISGWPVSAIAYVAEVKRVATAGLESG